MSPPRQPPRGLRAALDVDGVDQQRRAEILERPAGTDRVAQDAQRLLEIEGRRTHALHKHPEMVDPKQIAPSERARPLRHLADAHASRARGGDERANARPGIRHGSDAALVERLQYAYVREALVPAAAQDECDPADVRLR